MNNLLYVSTLSSKKVLNNLFQTGRNKPILSAQKFHRLIAEGLSSHSGRVQVQTLSCPPVTPDSHSKKVWILPKEEQDGVLYGYVPFLNFPVLKIIFVFLFTFFKTLWWCLNRKRASRVVFCDVLMVAISSAALLACKITGTRCVGIVTDIPGMIFAKGPKRRNRIFSAMHQGINYSMLTRFSAYILLTEAMNSIVNPRMRPYMVMEGLVESEMSARPNNLEDKSSERIIIYAGGLFAKYGIRDLIEAFLRLPDKDLRLHLFGVGLMVDEIKEYSKRDPRVVYMGMVPNEVVVADQLKATLLVNPRPTHEEYTKYSFPSKNMEYMASGTPTLTTMLPGMPDEYKEYVYLISDESVDGIYESFSEIFSNSRLELHEFGMRAKAFLFENKNNRA